MSYINYPRIKLELPQKVIDAGIFNYHPYVVLYGGRGGAKSETIGRVLVAKAHTSRRLILCAREFQSSIRDSVHRLIVGVLEETGLLPWFSITDKTIVSKVTGSEFIFKGLHYHPEEVKSLKGVTDCWVEEAEAVSEDSWTVLLPTLRMPESAFYISFNPRDENSPTRRRFVVNPPPNSLVLPLSWRDNPWFPKNLDDQRRYMMRVDPDAYDHIWEGHTLKVSEATIFKNKFEVSTFEPPEFLDRYYFGADWGFAVDPTVLVKFYIHDNKLWIVDEAYKVGCDLDKTPELFDKIDGSRLWPIKADSARPETINHMAGKGFSIRAAEKWPGSVEDGIAHMRGYEKIVIHERCQRTAEEFRLYSYKVDKQTNDVLPKIVDKHNHCIDAIRYGLDGVIQRSGPMGVWARLAS